ncbi:MAG: hypothetical protein BroJett018_29660 [Chloroflexota bacterium]|nr:MAG: hypothetical protein BroJett018_29660 [Chloroflexota bacterium]
MATGESKTKWNGNDESLASASNGEHDPFEIALTYPGKRTIQEILNTQPSSRLKQLWQGPISNSQLFQSRLYFADNLEVLAHLRHDEAVCGKVRLVYIDPPYSTNSVFKSRSQTDAYQDLLTGAHYLEFMRERLILLRELLAADGSIYVHVDDTMAFHIKILLDEIFGRKNFRNCITRRKCNPKNYTRRTYGNIADYIFFYTKTDQYVWNRPYDEWQTERAEEEYGYIEPETGRRFKKVPVHAPGTRNGETGQSWRGMDPPPGKHWQYPPRILDEMDARGEIFWSSNGNPRRKIYLEDSQGVPVQDIWWDFRDAHNQNIKITGYPTEKNADLLARIVRASSISGDIVMDCFAGSGTTLAAAEELGRSWIGIDNSPAAIQATLRRFAQGPQRMGDFVNKASESLQLGFREFQILTRDFAILASDELAPALQDSLTEWQQAIS